MRFQTIHSFLDKQLEFEINICGMANHDSTWLEEQSKPTYAVWIVDDGNVCITYNNKSYLLNKGDTFLFRPDIDYKAYTKSDSGCSFLYILFEAHVGGSNSSAILMTEGMVESKYVAAETKFVYDCFEKYVNKSYFALSRFKSAAMLLITKILTEVRENDISVSGEKVENIETLKTVLEYIDNNLHKNITVREIAEIHFMSEKYFITYFKKYTGTTPFKYISSLKLKKAYEYIGAMGYSVKHTSELLGYSDQYVFSKAFKRKYGFSPSRIQYLEKDSKEHK